MSDYYRTPQIHYSSKAYQGKLSKEGVISNMSRPGNPYNNALM
ncbi:hypothetical protein [Inediibacterium massiliense]|nr:hypothetical protein [Inediibacterium massiliense]